MRNDNIMLGILQQALGLCVHSSHLYIFFLIKPNILRFYFMLINIVELIVIITLYGHHILT